MTFLDARTARPADPLVSVVIPVYNGAAFLADALASVRAQTYPRYEIIVIDDGSRDDSGRVTRACPGVRYVFQSNQGIAAARNRGLSLACGEVIAFLDQDDYWAPRKIELQLRYLQANPDVAIVLAHERLLCVNGYQWPGAAAHPAIQDDHISVVPGVWLVWRHVFDRAGTFDTGFGIADDFDWFMRVRDAGFQFGVVPETLLFKRLHGNNTSMQFRAATREILRVFRSSIHRRRGVASRPT
jgi:glycosyltransferase involved in cell wall biosynthesis